MTAGPTRFSIVVAAYNAADTLGDTLSSLAAQTYPHWEAIVVDDGSTDETATIARASATVDARVRVISQENRGKSAARNAGLAVATGSWIVFLDSDDWLLPSYFERVAEVMLATEVEAVCTGWARATVDGVVLDAAPTPPYERLFETAARSCPFAIHSCVVRTEIARELGGFEESMTVCEDWDFWLRLARMAPRIGVVQDVVAIYRMRPGSAVTDIEAFVESGLRLIALGHGADTRVPRAAERYRTGLPRAEQGSAQCVLVCWAAGLMIGQGRDPRGVLDQIPENAAPALTVADVAGALFDGVLRAEGIASTAWVALWPEAEPRLDAFLAALERRSGARDLAARARRDLERAVLQTAPPAPARTIGGAHWREIDAERPIPDITLPAHVDRLRCHVRFGGDVLGTVELPVCDGFVPSFVVADAIVSDLAWAALGRFFAATRYAHMAIEPHDGGSCVMLAGRVLATLPHPVEPSHLHDLIGWRLFVEEVWGEPSARPPSHAPAGPRRLTSPDNVVEVSDEPLDLEHPGGTVGLTVTAGGAVVARIAFDAPAGVIEADAWQARVMHVAQDELFRVVVREAVIRRSIAGDGGLRERLARRPYEDQRPRLLRWLPLRTRPALPSHRSWWVVPGRRAGTLGTATARRGTLPVAALDDLRAAGFPLVAPRWTWRAASVARIPDAVDERYGGPSTVEVEPNAPASGAWTPPPSLPILMYHEIADTGPAATARYRLSAAKFEAQTRYLREAGYVSVTLDEWCLARRWGRKLPDRIVLFTFDDAYRDFRLQAWPILRRYGFSAMVFVVTDCVGRTSSWDANLGAGSPLLDWDEIAELHAAGVQFGSHTATHPHLTALSPAAIVKELTRSAAALRRVLGRDVGAIAYPHGAEDGAVCHLAAACGYTFGLSCRSGRSRPDAPLLALPRIEVTGQDTLADFVAKVEQTRIAGQE